MGFQQAHWDRRELGYFQDTFDAFYLERRRKIGRQADARKAITSALRHDNPRLQPLQQVALHIQQIRRCISMRARVAMHIKTRHTD